MSFNLPVSCLLCQEPAFQKDLKHEISRWKWSMLRRTAPRRVRKIFRTLRSLSPKATRRRMIWQKQEQCGTKGLWRKREEKQYSRSEMRCTQVCSMQPAFTVWWRNGKIVKNSSRNRKKSQFSWTRKERGRNIDSKYTISKKIHKTKKKLLEVLKNGESVNWEVMMWSEEWTDREKF